MARWLSSSVLSFLLALFATLNVASADDSNAPQAMLVMDYSGSMWGQIEGQPKIDVAREVVSEMMERWDPRMHLGMIAYGHSRRRDCQDIEVVLPVAADSHTRVRGTLYSMSPKGRTPLASSLIKAAKTMDFEARKATVILVSDGLETCGMSPCDVAADLRAQGVDFTVHLVGYDISPEQRSQLECIASATGGRYLDANSIDALRAAMKTAIEDAVTLPDDNFYPVLAEGGERLDIKAQWQIAPASQPSNVLERAEGPIFTPNMEPGDFIVTATWKGQSASKTVSIRPDQQQEHEVVISAGKLTLKALTQDGVTADWTVTSGSDTLKASANSTTLLLPAGPASINASAGEQRQGRDATVVAAKTTTETFDFRPGTVVAKTAGGADVEWVVTQSGSDKVITRTRGANANFSLPAGEYLIVANDGRAKIPQSVTVLPNGNHELVFAMQGALRLSAVEFEGGPAAKVAWTILDEQGNNVFEGDAAQTNAVLPKGQYTVFATHKLVTKKVKTTVAPAQDSQVAVSLDLGLVDLNAVEFTDKAIAVAWQSKIADRGEVDWVPSTTLKTQLPAGKYRITADHPDSVVTQDIVVTAGKTTQATYTMYGQIQLRSFDAKGGTATPVSWSALRKDSDPYTASGATWTQIVPPGNYAVAVDHPAQQLSDSLEVKAGQSTSRDFNLDIGTLQMAAFGTSVQEPIAATWAIQRIVDGNAGKIIAEAQGQTQELVLPAGQYRVSALSNDASETVDITLTAGGNASAKLLMYGIVEATLTDAPNGQTIPANWQVNAIVGTDKASKVAAKALATQQGKAARFVLPRGAFVIKATHPAASASRRIKIIPGKVQKAQLSLGVGYIEASAFRTSLKEAVAVKWSLHDGTRRLPLNQAGKTAKFTVPAGRYTLSAGTDDTSETTVVDVKAGQIAKPAVLMYGVLQATLTDAPKGNAIPADWQVMLPNGEHVFAKGNGKTVRFVLPRGAFNVIANHPAASTSAAIDILPGKLTETSLSLNVGYIDAAAYRTNTAEPLKVDWTLLNSKGKTTASSKGHKGKFIVPAGQYTLSAAVSKANETVTLNVKPGKTVKPSILLYGVLVARATDAPKGRNVKVDWSIEGPIKMSVAKQPNVKIVLSRGSYNLSAVHSASSAFEKVSIEPGKVTQRELNLNIGTAIVRATELENGRELEVSWKIRDASGNVVRVGEGTSQPVILKAGTYQYNATHQGVTEGSTLAVVAGKQTVMNIALYGLIDLSAHATEGGAAENTTWRVSIVGNEGEVYQSFTDKPEIIVPSGDYEVVASHDLMDRSIKVNVQAGKRVEKRLGFTRGTLSVSAFASDDQPVDVAWTVLGPSDQGGQKLERISQTADWIVAPGEYVVTAKHEGSTVSKKINVDAGKASKHRFDLALGRLKLRAHIQGKPLHVNWQVQRLDDDGATDGVYEAIRGRASLNLRAGKYRVIASHDFLNIMKEVTVRAGQTERVSIQPDTGRLYVIAKDARTDQPVSIMWQLTAGEETIANHVGSEWSEVIGAGDYELHLRHKGKAQPKMRISIGAGQTNTQTIYIWPQD